MAGYGRDPLGGNSSDLGGGTGMGVVSRGFAQGLSRGGPSDGLVGTCVSTRIYSGICAIRKNGTRSRCYRQTFYPVYRHVRATRGMGGFLPIVGCLTSRNERFCFIALALRGYMASSTEMLQSFVHEYGQV